MVRHRREIHTVYPYSVDVVDGLWGPRQPFAEEICSGSGFGYRRRLPVDPVGTAGIAEGDRVESLYGDYGISGLIVLLAENCDAGRRGVYASPFCLYRDMSWTMMFLCPPRFFIRMGLCRDAVQISLQRLEANRSLCSSRVVTPRRLIIPFPKIHLLSTITNEQAKGRSHPLIHITGRDFRF